MPLAASVESSRPPLHLSHQAATAPEQPISRLMAEALRNPELISLAAGFVDERTLPCKLVAETVERLMQDPVAGRSALQYGLTEGDAVLRRQIAERYFAADHATHADAMVLSTGSNQLLHLISDCLLEPGDVVICAAPTYFVYLAMLRDLGVTAISVAGDVEGMLPADLDATLTRLTDTGRRDQVKVLYLVPYFDNPAATTMSVARRREILEVLERHDASGPPIALLADNAYRDLRYDGEDLPCFVDCGADPTRTLETGTFSKNLSPGIRVGWGVLPEPLRGAVLRRKSVIDFGSPQFNQAIVRELLVGGDLDQHLREVLLPSYRSKRDAMVAACERWLRPIAGVAFDVPEGGMYVWLRLPETLNASPGSSLWDTCVQHGVLYVPGEYCFASEGAPVQANTMRLSFGVQEETRITRGIELLAEAVRAQLG